MAERQNTPSFGGWLKHWRSQQGYSQLDLAVASSVSQRHISFLESGRSNPSREMVLQLAVVLDIPLRDQNLMLTTAGFASLYTESNLDAPEMAPVRQALDFMLQQQEPFPALAMDRYWNLRSQNRSAATVTSWFIDADTLESFQEPEGINLMRLMFHPQGLRPYVVNWNAIASQLIQRVYREAVVVGKCASPYGPGFNHRTQQLLQDLLSQGDIPSKWTLPDWQAHPVPLLTLHLRKGKLDLQFFSTLATLGTAYDITLQELRIEYLFPADEATRQVLVDAMT